MMRHKLLVSLLLLLSPGFTSLTKAAAKSTGWVYQRGRGNYIENGEAGHWTLEGVQMALTPRSDEQ